MRKCIFVLSLFTLILSFGKLAISEELYQLLRKRMVEEQIIARGIKDKAVIKAFLKVERHKFLPPHLRLFAYEDSALPIGEGQTISQPYMVALMTELVELKPTDRVLEIGTGSGYQAAILAELAKEVYTIEILPSLAEKAKKVLKELGYKNIQLRCADGYLGWPEASPFDAIVVTCAPEEIPPPLIEQLAEGGRMIIPLGREGEVQDLVLIRKKNSHLEKTIISTCLFVPMKGKAEELSSNRPF